MTTKSFSNGETTGLSHFLSHSCADLRWNKLPEIIAQLKDMNHS